MNTKDFCTLIENLTGTPTKGLSERDLSLLDSRLNDDQQIDCSEFNELLLLVNKDRVEQPFFHHFFGKSCRIADLSEGVKRFQQAAMREYGNFIYAYRRLSRTNDATTFARALGDQAIPPDAIIERFKSRRHAIVTTTPIARHETYFIGYLSASELIADGERVELLRRISNTVSSWEELETTIKSATTPREHPVLLAIVSTSRLRNPSSQPEDFFRDLEPLSETIAERRRRVDEVRRIAAENQDIYLTWDHMDVYFATSMRKRWEYEDLAEFVDKVMNSENLQKLKLRYFDPTQAYTSNRINKGLVEALMLKRAKCTVYSVQDTDTLGKDSELAATLAQGKPVIAFVPEVDIEQRTAHLREQSPSTLNERLRFVIYEDKLSTEESEFLRTFHALDTYDRARPWRSLPDDEEARAFRAEHQENFAKTCAIVASAERRIYDKRYTTLRDNHPLGIQVNLDTGVANGVLVVRTPEKCAELLGKIVTNMMEFTVEDDPKNEMWYLREVISGSIYRVVTKNRKLTNCFWNFYLREQNYPEVPA